MDILNNQPRSGADLFTTRSVFLRNMRQTGQHRHELGTCDPDGSADPCCGQAATFDHAGNGACRKAQILGDLHQGQPLIGRERRWPARGRCSNRLRCIQNPRRQIRCVRPLIGTRRVVLMWLAPRWCLRHGAYDHGHPQRAKAEPSVFWDRFCVAGGYEKMWIRTGGSNLSPSAIQPIGIVLFLGLSEKNLVCFKGYRPRALHRVQPGMPLPGSLSDNILQSSRLHRFQCRALSH
jgi:hypothetical protein